MHVMTLDGPTKTGKTCAGQHLLGALRFQADGPVRFDSIGEFYRRMTVALIEEVGPSPTEGDLMPELLRIIDEDVAFDNGRDWGDLHSAEVNALVSSIGCLPVAQATKFTWAERATAVARDEGTGLWIVDGRNPRRTLAKELAKPDTHHFLDLFIDCDIDVAAQRSGGAIEELTRRRSEDVSTDDPLLVYPEFPVPYEPISTDRFPEWFADNGVERDVVASMWGQAGEQPTPVYLDTTVLGISDEDLGLGRMKHSISMLAGVALEWYNTRDVQTSSP